jgi:hypothetical protein
LAVVSEAHEQTVEQIHWLTTRIKETAPQTLAAG